MPHQSKCLVTSSVAILFDWQNVRGTEGQLQRLMNFASKLGSIVFKRVYAHWRREDPRWENVFDELGFDCLNVPSSKQKKNNVDKKLIAHCRQQILNNPDITTVILLSGDGDFKGLVRDLKAKAKKVIVIGKRLKTTSTELREVADEFYLLGQLC